MPQLLSADRDFRRIARVRLRHRRITIGRAIGNTLTLPDPRISRRHCEIRLSEQPPRILDVGSTHGVLVNGRHVRQTHLHDGDRIELGSFRLTFIDRSADEVGADGSEARCPCLEIECRSSHRDGEEVPEEYDRVLGEALKQIEFLKRQLLERNERKGESAEWSSESADAPAQDVEAPVRDRAAEQPIDPPLPMEMLFQIEGEPPRSMVDVDLGKWFVSLLLVLLAVALLSLFI